MIKQTKFQSKPRKFNIFAPLVYNVFDDFFRNKVEKDLVPEKNDFQKSLNHKP